MSPPTHQVTIAKSAPNGILPIAASATQKEAKSGRKTGGGASRNAGPRLKVVIRRLPPALTLPELELALGDEWKLGAGRVDWFQYRPGKESKDAAKPSIPARAYFHLTDQTHLKSLSDTVRHATIHDTKGTWSSPVLLGPPSVEFAPYVRTPGNKRRQDARQGTIDQDAEFIAFLESLTNPVAARPGHLEDGPDGSTKKEKVTITPLVQYLKDKKASKGKDAPLPSKSLKHSRSGSKDSRVDKVVEKKALLKSNTKEKTSEQRRANKEMRIEKATKEAVKVLHREASALSKKQKSQPSAPSPSLPPAPLDDAKASLVQNPAAPVQAAPERRRERGNASAAARILQRDLGLATNAEGRRATNKGDSRTSVKIAARTSNPPDNSPAPVNEAGSTGVKSTSTPKPSQEANKNKPVVSNKAKSSPNATASAPVMSPNGAGSKPTPAPTRPAPSRVEKKNAMPGDTGKVAPQKAAAAPPNRQAFLKHANASQGVTDLVLRTAMEAFGRVSKVEVDKKKGFAYVDFEDADGLQKAIKSSPVKVAEAQVVVVEFKVKGSNTAGAGSGSGRGAKAERGRGSPSAAPRGGAKGRGRGGPQKGNSTQSAAPPVTNGTATSTTAPAAPKSNDQGPG
ncbi:MAG: hypothetical protein M1825_005749 [Sarcosagium campestre]|nr:MAG: hypothetical protein M1825_005749 [Sarcosagium campestre]